MFSVLECVAECEVADREKQEAVGAGRHLIMGWEKLRKGVNLGSCLNYDSCVENGFEGDKNRCREIRALMQWSK